jgi:hypothetical protein
VERGRPILGGGLREHLRIQTTQGNEIFVVNRLHQKIAELDELLR